LIRLSDDVLGPEIVVPPDEEPQARVKSQPTANGSMVFKPLEDRRPFFPSDEFLANLLTPRLEE
jgi:hypothetical protein